MKRWYEIACSLVVIFAIAGNLVRAQATFATLRGTLDATDAAVSDAAVMVKNLATGSVRSTRSDDTGAYSLFDLPPSTYEMTVTAPNFAVHHRTGIELTIGSERIMDCTLNPSPVESTIA